jgi:hypothetical protein
MQEGDSRWSELIHVTYSVYSQITWQRIDPAFTFTDLSMREGIYLSHAQQGSRAQSAHTVILTARKEKRRKAAAKRQARAPIGKERQCYCGFSNVAGSQAWSMHERMCSWHGFI